MHRQIPIRNVYFLYCYAWDRFPEGRQIEVDATESPNLIALLARTLIRGLNSQIRRGLFQGYKDVRGEVSQLRGRLQVGETLRRHLHIHGRAVCEYDEFQRDVLPNQIIKATLRAMARCSLLEVNLLNDVKKSLAQLRDVSDIRLELSHFRRAQVTNNLGLYHLILQICLLAHQHLLPEEGTGHSRFLDPLDNEERMSDVFEKFVRNFYRLEQSEFASVASEEIRWDASISDSEAHKFLPTMRTDITLRSRDRTIIVDTKYYKSTLSTRYDKKRIWSSHLYQLFAYQKNLQNSASPVEGILLYPTVGDPLDLRFVLSGNPVRVATVNLDQPWRQIHERLISLLKRDSTAVAA